MERNLLVIDFFINFIIRCVFFALFLLRKKYSSHKRNRTAKTPKTDPIIIALLLFGKALVVDTFLQKLEMEVFLSNWQVEYCTELQRVQAALSIWSNEPGNTDAKLQRSSSSKFAGNFSGELSTQFISSLLLFQQK